jgi:ABC-2 type transport system ATP-binding protein
MKPAIETKDLVKRFGDITAVDGLSLRVAQGEIYAFLGLNGAGKTTTIRLLLGLVKPTAGEAHVLGTRIRVGNWKPWHAVGYLVETADAYPELSLRENLEAMRRLRPGTEPHSVDRIIERLALVPYANRRAGTLSHGNKQRLGLAKALLHNPELLILDEPASGLDPAGIVEIRNLLTELAREQGVTVFLSSHVLSEVSRLAQRIGIIHQGVLLQELDREELERNRRQRLVIQTRNMPAALMVLRSTGFTAEYTVPERTPLRPENDPSRADSTASPGQFTMPERPRLIPEYASLCGDSAPFLGHAASNGFIEVTDTAAVEQPEVIATHLVHAGHPPTMLQVEREDLERYFLRLVGQPIEGQA